METLAGIYITLARYQQALPLLEQALRVREARRTWQPIEYARTLESLASLWSILEDHDKAEPYFRRAFEAVQKSMDHSWREGVEIACGLSVMCRIRNRLDEAESLAQSALALAEKKSGSSPLVADCLRHLSFVRQHQDRLEEAEALLRRGLEIRKKCSPRNPLVLHEDLSILGTVLRQQSRWAEAEDCYRETLRLRDEYLAPEDLAIAHILENYAELLELMNRMDEAHAFVHRAKQIREFHARLRIV